MLILVRKLMYLQAHCRASLLDCFHGILDLMDPALRTPCNHILVVLHHSAGFGACCRSKRGPYVSMHTYLIAEHCSPTSTELCLLTVGFLFLYAQGPHSLSCCVPA